MIVLWFMYLLLTVTRAMCQEDKDKPDITLLSTLDKGNIINHICVAGSNVNDSAITFITPLNDGYSTTTPESNYVMNGTQYPENEYDCDFETNNNSQIQKWTNAQYTFHERKKAEEEFYIQEPILDARWESKNYYKIIFYFLKEFPAFSHKNHQFNSVNFNIGVSVMTEGDASILLCAKQNPMQCYWITLNENNTITLRKCINVNKKKIKLENSRCSSISLDSEVTMSLQEKNWNHFFISSNSSRFSLSQYKNNKIYNLLTKPYSGEFEYTVMYLHLQKKLKGLWKIHNYTYLSLNKNAASSKWRNLGPTLRPENNELCVAFYAATCEECTLKFRFSDKDQIHEVKHKRKWQYIKLTHSDQFKNKEYQLQVFASSSNFANSFWLIDDVRRCHLKETRVIKMSTSMDETDIVSCQALKIPEWRSSNKGGKVETPVKEICGNVSYIGNNCDISCSSVLGNGGIYCNKHVICKSTNKSNDLICSCAAGFSGSHCQENCSLGYYGYNCKNVCMPCKGYCSKSIGICPPNKTCTPTDFENATEGCQRSGLFKLLEIPQLINSTLTTITIEPVIKETKDNSNIFYVIQYKKVNETNWINHENKTLISKLKITTIYNLLPLNNYKIRSVLFDENEGDTSSSDDSVSITVFTDCRNISSNLKYYKNLTITKHSTDATVRWTAVCNATLQFKLYIKDNIHQCKDSPIDLIDTTKNKFTIKDLIPNTTYGLEINVMKRDKTVGSETTNITTDESELPILNGNINVIETISTVTIKFDRNDITKGELAHMFEVQYKELTADEWKYNKKLNVYASNTFTIEHLERNRRYHIRVVLYTKDNKSYEDCIPIKTVFTNCKDPKKFNLIKNLKVKPNENNVNITWTPVCENKFRIEISCMEDPWCEKLPKIPSFNSSYKSNTIKNMIPFTKYSMKFEVHDGKKDMEIKNFTTRSAAPPPVSELQVYSVDSDNIKVRFKKPYPPYGKLDGYESCIDQSQCQNVTLNQSIQDCELWDDFQCLTIQRQYNKDYFNVSVAGKNKNVSNKGKKSFVTIKTTKETEAPINLHKENLEYCWHHPNFTRGTITAFKITVTQIETLLNHNKPTMFTNPHFQKNVTKLEKKYCYKVDTNNLQLSSKYNISIQGQNKNNELGQSASTEIYTSPIQPKLVNNVTMSERTNNTQRIIIPEFDQSTLTKNSSVFVVVCDQTSKHRQPKYEMKTALKQKLIAWVNCTGVFWVENKLNVTYNETSYTVGEAYERLRPDVNYTITVLLVNEYNHEYSHKKYSFITSAPEPPSTTLYALILVPVFLLLIVLVVGIFVYRKYRKPKMDNHFPAVQDGNIIPRINFLNSLSPNLPSPNNNETMRNFFHSLSRNLTQGRRNNLENEQELPLINSNGVSDDYTKLVKISNLSEYIKTSLENGELERQHALFPKNGTKPWEYGMSKENKSKNRYNNLTAYDHSRVILNKLPGDPFSDFINANYIDGYKKPKASIATQGPRHSTLNDFWRMIWQEKVKYIVMLANLVESNKSKCEKYWPEIGETDEYHNIFVTFLKTDIYSDFEYRTFEVTCEGITRKIQHLHFTSWPDHGVPQYPQSLVPFLRKILTIPLTAPIVVHCSAGVGRTGTIILADICLRMAAMERQVDVLKYMHSIREQRAKLVDNFDQYKLVHMVLLECLLAPETSIPCDNLSKAVDDLIRQGGIQKQMAYLKDTAWHNQVMKRPMQIEPQNLSKNRFPDIVPNSKRIFISRYPFEDEFSDYINAIPVDGFKTKDQFIVTQAPLPRTVKDFWRMIFEFDVKVIVSLNKIMITDKTCCIFWPLENGQYTPVPYLTLNFLSIKEGTYYDIYNIKLVNTASEGVVKTVSIIQFKNWKWEQIVPDDPEELIRTIDEAQNLSRRGNPIVVVCYDGATASGLFVALSFLIEKIKLEQICDVCQAVRSIRINRPQFISHRKQFEFLYHAAVNYLASFDDYSNFEVPQKY